MSELTISGFSPQISWPFGGDTATLRYQYSADFVDSDGQLVLRGLYKDVACTIAAGVLSAPSHTIITTNDALVNPLSTLSARLLDASGAPRVWLFQNFSIPESLTPTTTIGDLQIYNQGVSLVLPPDAYLTRDQVVALIAERLPNVILASDVLLGLTRLSVAPASALLPIAVGDNDPRNTNTRTPTDNTVSTAKLQNDAVTYAKLQNVSATDKILGRSTSGAGDVEEIDCTAAGRALLDDANAPAQLITLGLTATAAELNKLDGAGTIVASGTQQAHIVDPTGGSVIDVQARAAIVLLINALEAFQINAA